MNKISWFVFVLLLGLFSSCNEEDVNFSKSEAIDISTSIKPLVNTRVVVSEEGNGHFTEADRITLLVTPDGTARSTSHELTYNGTDWSPRLTWFELQTSAASFAAVYPACDPTDAGEFIHEVIADQRLEENYRNSDLLYAATTASRGQRVNLEFQHKMSRIVVHLSSAEGAFTEEQLASAVLTVKAYRKISFDMKTAESGSVSGNTDNVIFHPVSGSTFHAIVCPQSLDDDFYKKGWIEIRIGDQQLTYKAPELLNGDIPFKRLDSGKQVTLNIKLTKSGVGGDGDEVDWRNKTCWVDGLRNIPDLNQWGYYVVPQPGKEVYALEWMRGYGWYDCNKKDPTGPAFGDMNLCWAATCSNMIYWWLDRNAGYIERYGYKEKGGPYLYENDKDCEVFQFYKDHFTDKGLFIEDGLNWFMTGKPVRTGPGYSSLKGEKHNGFFTDVLKSPVCRNASGGGYNLAETLKEAFLNKEAIGLSVSLNKGTAGHAITVWGAGFDEKGEVNMLYVCENNDVWASDQFPSSMRPGRQCNAGIFSKRVRIDEYGRALIEGGAPGICSIEILNLTIMGQHTEEWKDYFKSH